MAKKKVKDVESEFEKVEKVIENNEDLKQDEVIQTLVTEYRRLKTLSNRIYKEIDRDGVSITTEGSQGQMVYKSHPLLKDYANISSKLVTTCSALKDLVAKQTTDDDWMF